MSDGRAVNAIVRSREMGLTRADFFRLLPTVLAGSTDAVVYENTVTIGQGSRAIRIELDEGESRRLGTLKIPVLHVLFRFYGHSTADAEAFLARFDRAFQRGGG